MLLAFLLEACSPLTDKLCGTQRCCDSASVHHQKIPCRSMHMCGLHTVQEIEIQHSITMYNIYCSTKTANLVLSVESGRLGCLRTFSIFSLPNALYPYALLKTMNVVLERHSAISHKKVHSNTADVQSQMEGAWPVFRLTKNYGAYMYMFNHVYVY